MRRREVDQPATQEWKRRRLEEIGERIPTMVPVDFEAGEPWWERLLDAGFDAGRPADVASTGVSMYLTINVTSAVLTRIAAFAACSLPTCSTRPTAP